MAHRRGNGAAAAIAAAAAATALVGFNNGAEQTSGERAESAHGRKR